MQISSHKQDEVHKRIANWIFVNSAVLGTAAASNILREKKNGRRNRILPPG